MHIPDAPNRKQEVATNDVRKKDFPGEVMVWTFVFFPNPSMYIWVSMMIAVTDDYMDIQGNGLKKKKKKDSLLKNIRYNVSYNCVELSAFPTN